MSKPILGQELYAKLSDMLGIKDSGVTKLVITAEVNKTATVEITKFAAVPTTEPTRVTEVFELRPIEK